MVFLNELRHRKNTTLILKFPLADKNLPAAIAIAKNRPGIVKSNDYRGIPVLAAYRPVVGTDWHLIAKIDRDEVLWPVWHMLQWVMLTSLIAISAIMLLIILLWRQQRRSHHLALLAHSTTVIEQSERRFRAVTMSAPEAHYQLGQRQAE